MNEDVRPFFFQGQAGQLYGCLHMPTDGVAKSSVVVLIPSLGHEYENAHRGLRVLAERLARAGSPVVRFDLSGLGDSSGEPSTVDPAQWDGDVDRAIAMARRRSGARDVILVGLRFGAVLAARAAARISAEGLVLWHPASPADMIAEWTSADAAEARAHGTSPQADRSLLGWQVTPEWLRAVAAYKYPEQSGYQATLILGAEGPLPFAADGQMAEAPSGPFWRHDLRDVLVPLAGIRAIEAFVEERSQ